MPDTSSVFITVSKCRGPEPPGQLCHALEMAFFVVFALLNVGYLCPMQNLGGF